KCPDLVLEALIDFILRSADAKHVCGQPRSAVIFENFEDFFPLTEGVQEHGHGANVERVCSEPQQVTRDPIELGHNDANMLGAGWGLYAEQFLDRFAIAKAIRDSSDVIHAIQRGNPLTVGLRFAQLLNTAMQIADHTLSVDNSFAIEFELYLQHPMRR